MMLNYLMYNVLILLLARTDSTVPFLRMFLTPPAAKKKEKKSREYSISRNERARLSPPAGSSYILTVVKRWSSCGIAFARKNAQRNARRIVIILLYITCVSKIGKPDEATLQKETRLSCHFIKLIMQVASNISWWVILLTSGVKGHEKWNIGRPPIHLIYICIYRCPQTRALSKEFFYESSCTARIH